MSVSLHKLEALPKTLRDGSITMRLEDGVAIFSASRDLCEYLEVLLEKEKFGQLTKSELEELEEYEKMDDYLSHLNRFIRNVYIYE